MFVLCFFPLVPLRSLSFLIKFLVTIVFVASWLFYLENNFSILLIRNCFCIECVTLVIYLLGPNYLLFFCSIQSLSFNFSELIVIMLLLLWYPKCFLCLWELIYDYFVNSYFEDILYTCVRKMFNNKMTLKI